MATADKLALLKATKANLKAALTEKGQNPGDVFDTYPDLVRAIETGTKLPDLTNPGAAADLRKGKQLIGQSGQIVTGTLEEMQQATPSISVSSAGLITATAGDKSATKQLATQAGGTRTPGTSDTTIVYAGQYATGNITMKGDANLIPVNIKSGVSIFGVSGTASSGSTLKRVTGTAYVDEDSSGVSMDLGVSAVNNTNLVALVVTSKTLLNEDGEHWFLIFHNGSLYQVYDGLSTPVKKATSFSIRYGVLNWEVSGGVYGMNAQFDLVYDTSL